MQKTMNAFDLPTPRLLIACAVLAATLAACAAPPTSAPAPDAAEAPTAPASADAPAAAITTTSAMTLPAPAAGQAPQGMPPGGRPPAFSVAPTAANVIYATPGGEQMLDLYLPVGDGPFPLVINIHGGGFRFGDKGMLDEAVGTALIEAGYAIASIDYRLSGEATFPAAVQDAKAAVRWLRANAAQYKLDPDKFAAFGQSAGGNIASMLGTAGDVAMFDDAGLGNAGVSSRVQAVINWFGPNDFSKMDEQAKAQGCPASDQTHDDPASFESAYLGAAVPAAPEQVQQADPITYISPDDPPFLVQKGDQDCTVPIENTKMLADALMAAGNDVEYDLLAGAGHGDTGGTPIFADAANVQRIVTWLDAKLK